MWRPCYRNTSGVLFLFCFCSFQGLASRGLTIMPVNSQPGAILSRKGRDCFLTATNGGWGRGNGWWGCSECKSKLRAVSRPTGPRRLRLRKAHRTAASSRRNLGRRVISLQRSVDGGGPTRRASLFQEVAPTAQSRETRVCLR